MVRYWLQTSDREGSDLGEELQRCMPWDSDGPLQWAAFVAWYRKAKYFSV